MLGAGGKNDNGLSGACWDSPHPEFMGSSTCWHKSSLDLWKHHTKIQNSARPTQLGTEDAAPAPAPAPSSPSIGN